MAHALSSLPAVEKHRVRYGFVSLTKPRDTQGLLSRHVTPPSPQVHFPTRPICPPPQTVLTMALTERRREHPASTLERRREHPASTLACSRSGRAPV